MSTMTHTIFICEYFYKNKSYFPHYYLLFIFTGFNVLGSSDGLASALLLESFVRQVHVSGTETILLIKEKAI